MFDWTGLAETARKAADIDVGLASDDELCAGLAALEEARCILEGAATRLIAEIHTRQASVPTAGLRTGPWLAHTGRLAAWNAAERVRVSTVLVSDLGGTLDRLVSGRVSWSHARVLADALAHTTVPDQFRAHETDLLDLAEQMVFEPWARHVAALIRQLDTQAATNGACSDTADREARGRLRLSRTRDGGLRLRGVLGDADGELTEQTLNTIADRLWTHHHHLHTLDPAHRIPTRQELLADALIEVCRGTANVEVTLVVEASDPQTAHTPTGVRLQDGTVRTLLCDPPLHPIIINHLGVPLDAGRTIRHATAAQRRALQHRDGGCVFPGCPTPTAHCDTHHLHPWHHGGPTDLSNLILTCRFHHQLIHQHHWQVHLQPTTGTTTWTSPHHTTHPGQQHHHIRAGPNR
jgi:hypothetical protein